MHVQIFFLFRLLSCSRVWFISKDKRWRKTFQKLNHITLTSFSRLPTNFHCAAGIKRCDWQEVKRKMFFLLFFFFFAVQNSLMNSDELLMEKCQFYHVTNEFFFLFSQHFSQRRKEIACRLPQLHQNIKVKLICGG